jgi:hypothetical protein
MKSLFLFLVTLSVMSSFSQQYQRNYNSRYRVNYSPGTIRGQVLDISSMKINPVYEQPSSQSYYVSNRGKQYVYVTSKKTGNIYKKYIK